LSSSLSPTPLPSRSQRHPGPCPSPLPSEWASSHRALPSFPTRRSSDLDCPPVAPGPDRTLAELCPYIGSGRRTRRCDFTSLSKKDRKSTRLNSSHVSISYAVFFLKKKKTAGSATKRRAWVDAVAPNERS